MIYPDNFEVKTGFNKIRQLLHKNTLSSLGDEWIDNIFFQTNYDKIITDLNLTNEFVKIIVEAEDFPQDAFYDVRESLQKIAIEGMYIEEDELFELRRSLETIGLIVKFFQEKEESDCYYLKELAKDVFTFPDIIRLIDRILDKFGKIKDNASPELSNIRKNILSAQSSISKTVSAILMKAQMDGYISKDTKPAIRDGRLVIPVNSADKRRIKGIVHDESATGKTVFIEPESAVEINNKVKELMAEEKREIIKILTTISNEIRPRIPEMLDSYTFLGQIDFIRAKALLAIETESTLPCIHKETIIDWSEAKHPILYLTHKASGQDVVPLSIELNKEQRILLISGPNAGGKSVCLKTVGLLQYMMQCGLLVPLHSSSNMGIFNNILIDIGDEQSIENDLSTYSSHLTNMKQFVKSCDERSILLIDEFGSGTEPKIGGAIAEALLNLFNQKKAFGVITTHYTNLKNFAKETDGIVNGAMLYDRHEMHPLFRLEIGNPGSSFAIEIARKIGLPESVIQEAIDKVGSDYVNLDKYLQDIVRDKRYWENKRQSIRQKEKRIEELSEKYEHELEEISGQRKEIMREAKQESKRILEQANSVIENTVRKIKEAQADKEKTKEARKELEEYKSKVSDDNNNQHSIDKKIERLKQREKKKETVKKEEQIALKVGQNVRIKGQTNIGKIIEIKGDTAKIAFGLLKTSAKVETLEPVSNNQIKKENAKVNFVSEQTSKDIHQKNLHFKREIDVRGMRGDEALQAVTYFIDDAIILNIDQVRILHGTGSGILRTLIRNYLKTIPAIESVQDEHVEFGGAGITVIKFR
ncbi:MAG: Smr/MutS family protein [Paludibacteraceae bacterium]|nr:Smr/MutS family protein [Paludibacteraceae bacterium]